MSAPLHPRRVIIPGTPAHRLLRGVLGIRAEDMYIERVDLARTDGWTISIVDSGDGVTWTPGGDTTLHMLWQMDEATSGLTVEDQAYPIAPGDTTSIPGGRQVAVPAGMLLVRVETTSRTLPDMIPPSHGTDTFEGYNRRTDYEGGGRFALRRWKVTRPLTIHPPGSPVALICLADPLALTWSGGIDLIERGECRVVGPGSGPVSLLPDGLGYALVVS